MSLGKVDKAMPEDRNALERVASELMDWGPGPWLDRMAPMSVGAVVGGAAIVAASTVVRRLFRDSRALRWAGVLAAVPLGIWVLSSALDSEAVQEWLEDADLEILEGSDEEE